MTKRRTSIKKRTQLKPLSPVNDLGMEDHSYASCKEYLDDAFEQSDFKNIALSGNFGAGKSSILHSYDRHRNYEVEKFLYISLTDFQNYECDCKSQRNTESPKSSQTGTADEEVRNETGNQKQENSKNEDSRFSTQKRVEYNLLCQILARCRRKNLRDSSLRGIPEAATTIISALFGAVFVALVCALVFHEHFGRVAELLGAPDELRANIHSWLYVATAGMICVLVIYCLRRGKIQKVAFKSTHAEAEMALAEAQTSLDLYKFELIHALINLAPKIDHTVVFEDMDRLDPQICIAVITKLRDLNVMVNTRQSFLLQRRIRFQVWLWHCIERWGVLRWLKGVCRKVFPRRMKKWLVSHFPHLIRGSTHIRFVYAVGDDILDHKLRAKFYDCIIPVTPALNLFNSEDILCEILKENHVDIKGEQTWQTVKSIIPYLNDYRTLRTLSNEFRVLCSQFEGGTEDKDCTHASMLALTFYKVMVPKKHSQMFDEFGLRGLPEVTAEDFPEIRSADYRKNLANLLNKIRPSENMLQLLFLSRDRLCARWITALMDGPRERTMDAITEFHDNKLIDISAEIKKNRFFETTDDSGISSSIASYIYSRRTNDDEFESWFYASGKPEEHKFTNCIAFLTSSGQSDIPIMSPNIEASSLFDWCIKSLPSLNTDIGHESRWNKEMIGLLETVLSTQHFDITENLLDIQITEHQTLESLISWDVNMLDEDASEAINAEREMLEIINRFRSKEEPPLQHITRNDFINFCKKIYSSEDKSFCLDLAKSVYLSENIDISQELIENQIIEHTSDEIDAFYLISHLWKRMDQAAFDHWFFKITDPKYEKFAKCLSWICSHSIVFLPDQLFDWCLENLKIFMDPTVPRSCWTTNSLEMLGIIMRSSPTYIPEHIKRIVLFDGISVAELLEDDDTTEESMERSLAELM